MVVLSAPIDVDAAPIGASSWRPSLDVDHFADRRTGISGGRFLSPMVPIHRTVFPFSVAALRSNSVEPVAPPRHLQNVLDVHFPHAGHVSRPAARRPPFDAQSSVRTLFLTFSP